MSIVDSLICIVKVFGREFSLQVYDRAHWENQGMFQPSS